MNETIRSALALATIFLGSFLLFLIQPMIGNLILPYFGGTAMVWIVCLSTFQLLLIAGYAYAHYCVGKSASRVHILLLIVSAILFKPAVRYAGHFDGILSTTTPALAVVFFLLITVALPYVLLGANATLVQALVSNNRGGYRLYAVSSIGSFAGLLCYPIFTEPLMPLDSQVVFYSTGIYVYAILLSVLLVFFSENARKVARDGLFAFGSFRNALSWFVLSAASCFVLDSVSAHLCLDVSPLPLLWCLILALYLLTWSLAFTERGCRLGVKLAPVVAILSIWAALNLGRPGTSDYSVAMGVALALLFSGNWLIHSILYSVRPNIEGLTRYYFVLALGGAFGGVMASIVFPLTFSFVAEYPLALVALFALSIFLVLKRSGLADGVLKMFGAVGVALGDDTALLSGARVRWVVFAVAVTIMTVVAFDRSLITIGQLVCRGRNFYGTTKVEMVGADWHRMEGVKTCLAYENNGTAHGLQIANDGWRSVIPTAYYTENGGGMCLSQHPLRKEGKPLRAAFLGMGIGTLASYGRKDDYFRFYEINPTVADFSDKKKGLFTFICDSDAHIDVVVDDARKALEKESRQGDEGYDLIVVDVFSGDSIPAHLATREAMMLYLDRLNPEGIIAFHLSNWHLNLFPIAKAMAKAFSLSLVGVVNNQTGSEWESHWAYMSRNSLSFSYDAKCQSLVDFDSVRDENPISDNYHPMIRYVKLNHSNTLKFCAKIDQSAH